MLLSMNPRTNVTRCQTLLFSGDREVQAKGLLKQALAKHFNLPPHALSSDIATAFVNAFVEDALILAWQEGDDRLSEDNHAYNAGSAVIDTVSGIFKNTLKAPEFKHVRQQFLTGSGSPADTTVTAVEKVLDLEEGGILHPQYWQQATQTLGLDMVQRTKAVNRQQAKLMDIFSEMINEFRGIPDQTLQQKLGLDRARMAQEKTKLEKLLNDFYGEGNDDY